MGSMPLGDLCHAWAIFYDACPSLPTTFSRGRRNKVKISWAKSSMVSPQRQQAQAFKEESWFRIVMIELRPCSSEKPASAAVEGGNMARTLSMSFNWQGPMDYERACARVRLADEAGVDTVWAA